MKIKITLLTLFFTATTFLAYAQEPVLDEWILNTTGKTSSYWENVAVGMGSTPVYEFSTSSTLADVLSVCYDDDYVYIECEGMTNDMGQFSNPGAPSGQGYSFKFPRSPAAGSGTDEAPETFNVGVLLNGVPIFALGDGKSYDSIAGTTGPMGDGLWVGEAYFTEGETLDTAFAAHPQQQGGYHSHATPFRMYDDPSTAHSPIVGYANDGFPIYGPFGYSSAMDNSSSILRMTSSYQLRSITTRTILPDGTTSSPAGPDVTNGGAYDIGAFIQDYEYVDASGILDEHNGRQCVTPEYPNGTYAYFVTVDAAGTPAFPYYIGTTFYGTPIANNNTGTAVIPSSGLSCLPEDTTTTNGIRKNDFLSAKLEIGPNPSTGVVNIVFPEEAKGKLDIKIIDVNGRMVYSKYMVDSRDNLSLNLRSLSPGIYNVRILGYNQLFTGRIVKE